MSPADAPAFDGMPLDTRSISQDRLNIDAKQRSNLFPWNGQFSPQLVEVLLRTYAPAGSFVLDPFVGSGTVLHEAGRLGHPAFGCEVNSAALILDLPSRGRFPADSSLFAHGVRKSRVEANSAAHKMAAVYQFMNVKSARRKTVIEEAWELLEGALPSAPSLFSPGRQSPLVPLQQAITEVAKRAEVPLSKLLLEALVVLLDYGEKELTRDGCGRCNPRDQAAAGVRFCR